MIKKQTLSNVRGALLSSLAVAGTFVIINTIGAGAAHATAGTLGDAVTGFKTAITNGAQVVNGVLYIMGLAAFGAGAASLKKHGDNPGQEPIQKGLVRLVVATGLVSAPSLINQIANTTNTTGGGITEQTVGVTGN